LILAGYMRIGAKLFALGALKVINKFIVLILWAIQLFFGLLLYFW
jgi:hypothetical protein